MIKRIIPIILCLILVFSISVSATNTTEDTTIENNQAAEEFPQRQGGGRGNMGTPPEMPNGEMPPDLPEGMAPPEMQSRENQDEGNVPPQINGQVATENLEQSTDEKSENKILTFVKAYSTPITSIVLLLLAFVFVIFYKRKSY